MDGLLSTVQQYVSTETLEYGDLNWIGLDFGPDRFADVTAIDIDQWTRELAAHDELFAKIGDRRPAEFAAERNRLASHLGV